MEDEWKGFDEREFLNSLSLSEDDINQILDSGKSMSLDDVKNYTYIFEVDAKEKVGKTHFGESACLLDPRFKPIKESDTKKYKKFSDLKLLLDNAYIAKGSPVFVFDTENKAHKLFNVFLGKPVKIYTIWDSDPERAMMLDPKKMLKKLWITILAIQSKYKHGTILIDSSTGLNDLLRKFIQIKKAEALNIPQEQAYFVDLRPQDYGVRNDIMEYLVGLIQRGSQHAIFTVRMEEEWGMVESSWSNDGKQHLGLTGRYVPKRWKSLPFMVDAVLELYMEKGEDDVTRRMCELMAFAFDEKEPLKIVWEAPTFVDVVAELCKYSHKKILDKLKKK